MFHHLGPQMRRYFDCTRVQNIDYTPTAVPIRNTNAIMYQCLN